MISVNPSGVDHYRHLQRLRDSGALSPKGPHASISNPAWFHPQGDPAPDRQELHDAIIDSIINDVAPSPIGQQPVAILLAGPPGSGKSSARRALFDAGDERITGGLNASDFVVIDADNIKEKLLDAADHDGSLRGFLMPTEARKLQYQGQAFSKLDFASLVHEESSMIAEDFRDITIERRYNLILDQVCSDPKKTAALVDELVDQGYSVRVVEIHAEKEFSEQSVFLRYLRDYERNEGRYVPTEVIESVYDSDGMSRPRESIQNLLDESPCQIDAYRRFDAKVIGQPPMLTQRGHNVHGRIQLDDVAGELPPASDVEALPSKRLLLASFPNAPGVTRPARGAAADTAPRRTPGQGASTVTPHTPRSEKGWGR